MRTAITTEGQKAWELKNRRQKYENRIRTERTGGSKAWEVKKKQKDRNMRPQITGWELKDRRFESMRTEGQRTGGLKALELKDINMRTQITRKWKKTWELNDMRIKSMRNKKKMKDWNMRTAITKKGQKAWELKDRKIESIRTKEQTTETWEQNKNWRTGGLKAWVQMTEPWEHKLQQKDFCLRT